MCAYRTIFFAEKGLNKLSHSIIEATMNIEETSQLTKAEQFYARHLQRVRKYNQTHVEEIKERSKEYFQRLKADPERYRKYLEKRKEKYHQKKAKAVKPQPVE